MTLRSAVGIPIPSPAVALAAPGAPGGATKLLGVPHYQQSETNWCWAACCQMVFNFLGKSSDSQCKIASKELSLSCCLSTLPSGCDVGHWPDTVFSRYSVTFLKQSRSLTAAELKTEIDANRPVEVYYAWTGGSSAHVALVTGYHSNGDFEVHDPGDSAPTRHSHADLVSAYGLGTWPLTYSQLA